MSTSRAQRIENLHQQYEEAVQAYDADRTDENHAATVELAEKLATLRQDERVDQVKRGERTEGMGITAEQNSEG